MEQVGPLFVADVRCQRVSRMRVPPVEVAPRRGVRDPKGGAANINGEMHYLWRAVDQEGEVLESYVTRTRDKAAALRFM